MRDEPQDAPYRPDAAITAISDWIGDAVEPAAFPAHQLRFRNTRWDRAVGLGDLSDETWLDHFGRFVPLPDNLPRPLALRYHGHQFRNYNPEIGDGRGFLFGQLRDGNGRMLDLGTKGSGRTPYSRTADGRLTLKGAVREILATEMLEALGVYTSKTFSVVETGEELWRGDEPSPTRSAVLVRLGHSHMRIGTFQRLAVLDETDHLAQLVDYCLAQYPGPLPPADAPGHDEPAVILLHQAVERLADLAASYMVAGFVHGVLNSDNMAITGESFDYGPWRWLPRWDPTFTAAYFDHNGLYAFGRQPEAIRWNLGQLAMALRPLAEAEPLIAALARYGACYQQAMVRRFCWRLGVESREMESDTALIEQAEETMRTEGIGPDRYFHRERGLDGEPVSLLIEEVEDLWSAISERDDWEPLHAKIAAIRQLGQALGEPPVPSGHLPGENP
ncbi:YdiU family protein [Altererythrobacter sp. KTW20L]|uniref:protein adenylyltransferase SelO family protein n=1 Tax=Altererythrobacter sp. KTW20L TaxID=2942210 RepID=UPI0020BF7824|nr:YdiU family protein [Altererythrobacter sp. KTW20L]MCL6250639.1 YdiU family protein [Altererythrobacter sp. KTW20L]